MFVGIDGSGDSNDFDYQHANSNSLISQLVRTVRGRYFRGPTDVGLNTHSISTQVAQWILANRARIAGPLFMAGHSRGGAICIDAARQLKREQLSVECMLLLDAVDRSSCQASMIPGNVKFAYHAMRKEEIHSRTSFGHCGTFIEPPGVLKVCSFNATHAGMGGTPWSGVEKRWFRDSVSPAWMNRDRDYKGTNEIRTWAWMMLRKHGARL